MCAVSMISDVYGRQQPSNPITWPWPQTLPQTLPWTDDALKDLREILKKVDALDKKLGLAECEDPKKAEWMKSIEDRLKKLEGI